MGWASGSDVAYNMIKAIQENVPDDDIRRVLYETLIDSLEDQDCDTLCECVGIDPVYDEFFDEEEE